MISCLVSLFQWLKENRGLSTQPSTRDWASCGRGSRGVWARLPDCGALVTGGWVEDRRKLPSPGLTGCKLSSLSSWCLGPESAQLRFRWSWGLLRFQKGQSQASDTKCRFSFGLSTRLEWEAAPPRECLFCYRAQSCPLIN